MYCRKDAEKDGELSSCRISIGADVTAIQIELAGVGAHPTYRELRVNQLRGPDKLRLQVFRCESVVDIEHDETQAGKIFTERGISLFVA